LAADLDRFLAGQSVEAAPYHFRLDEREITAARPTEVLLAAFIFFVVGFFLFMTTLGMALMVGVMFISQTFGVTTLAILTLVAAAMLAVGTSVGRGLLAARSWARWVGVGVSALVVIGTVAGLIGVVVAAVSVTAMELQEIEKAFNTPAGEVDPAGGDAGQPQTAQISGRNFLFAIFAFYGFPLVVGMVLHGTALWVLLTRRTGEWFRLAREIRAEHRLVREQLAA